MGGTGGGLVGGIGGGLTGGHGGGRARGCRGGGYETVCASPETACMHVWRIRIQDAHNASHFRAVMVVIRIK